MTAPRLWGSVTPSSTTRNGTVRPVGPGRQGGEVGFGEGIGPGHHALGGVGQGEGVQLGSLHPAQRPRLARRGQGQDLRQRPGRIGTLRHRQEVHPAPPGSRAARAPPGGPPPARRRGRIAPSRRAADDPGRPGRPPPRGTGSSRSPSAPRTGSPRHQEGHREAGHPFAAAERPEGLGPLGLDAHRCARRARSAAAPCPAGRAPASGASITTVTSTLPTSHSAATRLHHPGEQVGAVGAGVGGVVVGKVGADVAEAGRAEQGVADGVGDRVGVAVAGQAAALDGDAAEDKRATRRRR